MYRMRRWPAPLSITLPPPSSTTTGEVLTTLAVSVMTMVTGSGPQSNVITPPCATASTTACDVHVAGVPAPITTSGCDVSTARASSGNGTPAGFPGRGASAELRGRWPLPDRRSASWRHRRGRLGESSAGTPTPIGHRDTLRARRRTRRQRPVEAHELVSIVAPNGGGAQNGALWLRRSVTATCAMRRSRSRSSSRRRPPRARCADAGSTTASPRTTGHPSRRQRRRPGRQGRRVIRGSVSSSRSTSTWSPATTPAAARFSALRGIR